MEAYRKDQEDSVTIAMEIEKCEEEKKSLLLQIEQQQIKPEDVEKVNSEKEQLLKAIDQLNQQKEEANKLFWEREIIFQKKFDAFEKHFHNFNHQGERIGIIPADAMYAKGINFEITLNPQVTKMDQLVTPSLKEYIQQSLFQLRDHLNDFLHASDEILLNFHEQLDTLNDTIAEKHEEFKTIEEKIKRYNQQSTEERECFNFESKKRADEMEHMEQELIKVRSETANNYISSQQFVQKANLE